MTKRSTLLVACSVCLVIFSMVVTSGHAVGLSSEEQAYLQQKGTIVFVSQIRYPPFEFTDANQQHEGMMLDVVRWMAVELGFQPIFIDMPFLQAQAAVRAGKADILTSLFFSEQRKEQFEFTDPLFDIPASIFVKTERTDIKDLRDLNGKTVAIQKGDFARDFLISQGIHFTAVDTHDFAEATESVRSGQADAIIGDEQIVLYHIFSNRLTAHLKKMGEPLYIGKNCMAANKGNTLLVGILNKGIIHARQTGVLDKISKKWLGAEFSSDASFLGRYFWPLSAAAGGLLLLSLGIWAWNVRLRALVQKKTADITRNEEALHKSEEKFRSIFEHSWDGILFTSPDGRVFTANRAACQMLGWSEEEICESGRICVTDATDPRLPQALAERDRTGCFCGELTFRRKDGTPFPVELSSTSFSLANGKLRTCIIFREISARKRTEETLKQIMREQQIILETANIGISLLRDRRQIWANQKTVDMFQYAKEALEGQTTRSLYPSEEEYEQLGQAAYPVLAQGQLFEAEQQLLRRDGTSIWVRLIGKAVDPADLSQGTIWLVEDITERKQARDALRASEEQFRKLFEGNAAVMLLIAQDTGKIIEANLAAAHFYGWSMAELGQMHIEEINTLPLEAVRAKMEQALLSGSQMFGFRHRRADGSIRDVEVFSSLIEIQGKNVLYSIIHDITERKQVERALLESEEKYRQIFENKGMPICIFDLETLQFIEMNTLFPQLYGYSREEMLGGMAVHDISAEPSTSLESIQKAHSEGGIFVPLRYHKKKDGTVFPVEIVAESYLFKGRQVMFGMVRDISRRKQMEDALQQSQERLALAMKANPVAIWDWDLLTDEMYYSPRWWRIIGYEVNELKADSGLWRRQMHPEDRERANAVLSKAVAQEATFEIETRMLHKKGHYVPILTRAFILRDDNGRAVRISGTDTDLTERKRIAEEQRQWERQLQQIQKAESLNRMAGAIAHHFNNLLGAVRGNLEMAMEDLPQTEEPFKFLSAAVEATDRAVEVSGLMLTYLGQAIIKHELLDLSDLCRSSLALLKGSIQKDIVFKTDIPPSGPAIKANASQIQRILMNLGINAAEAIGEHRGTLSLTLSTVSSADIATLHRFPLDWQPQEEHFACLEVRDTGAGIAAKDIEKLFDPFFSSKFTGRGLGLSVVLGILRSHRGGVTVESHLGQGSIFRIYLPVLAQQDPLQSDTGASKAAIDAAGTVLLVEDEEVVRAMAATMLCRLGFTVLLAKDGVEAVELFRQHQDAILAVLCDLTMPGMDGWETLAALRTLAPGIPAILASGYDEAQVMQGNHPELPQAFLQKPFKREDLQMALAKALESSLR